MLQTPRVRAALLLGLLFATGPLARAQQATSEAAPDRAAVLELIRAGTELEHDQRWGEALSHYERAVRTYPESTDLQRRMSRVRLHYEVCRRYADASFLAVMGELQAHEAVDVYAEILLKIHAHYVDRPQWQKLVFDGLGACEVALREPSFCERHAIELGPAEVRDAIDAARRRLNRRSLDSRHAAREAVMEVARDLGERLRVRPSAFVFEFACAATAALDSYSTFLTGNQLDEVLSQIEGNFVGLGIELKTEAESLLVVDVIPGGPAADAGIRPRERIVMVDGHSTEEISTDVAADMLKGDEGSQVELLVVDPEGQSRRVRLRRKRVEVPSIEQSRILDPALGIAYLKLTAFQKTTSRDLEQVLWQLHRDGMRSLIVDVRGNPGGLLTAAVEVADKFIDSGSIVATRGRSSGESYDYKAHRIGTWRVPLTVLVDGESASASEVFAGAIRDHRRGTIVGTRTYGKGSVQGIFPLHLTRAGIRLTTAKFYSPHGHPISRHGVRPDVSLQQVAKPVVVRKAIAPRQDPAIDAGLKIARQQLAHR